MGSGVVPIGADVAVCIREPSKGTFGVVYIERNITCATCKYGSTSCKHVAHLSDIINEIQPEDLPDYLLPFANFTSAPLSSTPVQLKCMSTVPISFDLPQHLKDVIKQDPQRDSI